MEVDLPALNHLKSGPNLDPPSLFSMRLNRLAWHPQVRWLAHSATARMAPALQGSSGRVYLQGQMLQRHPQGERLSVFKAEYVLAGRTIVGEAGHHL
jgi:hypothetical protein